MSPIRFIAVSCLFLFAAAQAGGSAEPFSAIRIGYVNFPPYTYTDENGEAAGRLNALTRQVLVDAGIPHEFIELPAKRISRYMQTGELDLFHGLSPLPEYKDRFLVSESRLATIRLMAYHLPDTPAIESFQDLASASVVSLLGYSYGAAGQFMREPDNKVRMLAVRERESAFEVLSRGRADYFVDYNQPALQAMGEERLASLIQTPVSEISTYWVIRKSHPQAEQLVQALDRSYLALEKSGKLRSLLAH